MLQEWQGFVAGMFTGGALIFVMLVVTGWWAGRGKDGVGSEVSEASALCPPEDRPRPVAAIGPGSAAAGSGGSPSSPTAATAPLPVLRPGDGDRAGSALAARGAARSAALEQAERLVPGISRALASTDVECSMARSTWTLVMLRWAVRPTLSSQLWEAFDAETLRLLALLPDLESEAAVQLAAAGGSDLAVAIARRCIGDGHEKLLRSVEADLCELHDAVVGKYLEGRWSD